MTEDNSKQIHKYHWTWWTIFFNFSTSIFMLPMLTLLIGSFGFFLYALVKNGIVIGIVIFALFSPLILSFIILWFWYLFYPFGRLLFSYFTISPQGIEYRYWPTYGVQCEWDDVDKLGKFKSIGFDNYDVLYLKQAKPIGKPIMMNLRKMFGLKTQYFIPLKGMHGWPHGKLKDDLQSYAPQLFADKVLNEKTYHPSEDAS